MEDIQEKIGAIVSHVESLSDNENKLLLDAERAVSLLEQERETMGIVLGEKLDQILSTKFRLEKRLESEKDKRDEACQSLAVAENSLADIKKEEARAEKDKREALEKVEEAKRALDQFKSEAEKVSEMANNVPKLSQNKKLYYSVSRLTFDKSAKKNEVKGFVVNPRKDDVNTFNFTIGEEGVSPHFVTNYLWDVIGAGAAPEWDNV